MKKENSYLWRIFTLNLLLVIPLLISSVLGTVFLRYDTFRESKINREKLFHNTSATISELLNEYGDKAAVICTEPQLSKALFEQKGPTQTEAFDVLNTMMIADSRLTNMFIDFDMTHLCSMKGLIETEVLFHRALGCNVESIERGVAFSEAKQTGVSFLQQSERSYLLLLGTSPRNVGSRNAYVAFVFNLNDLGGIFRVIDNDQWYLLKSADGSSCAIGFDSSGQAILLSGKEVQQLVNSNKFDCLTETLDEYGLTISLYSAKFFSRVGNDVWNIQIFNIALLLIAIFLSVFLSWRSGEKRIADLMKYREYLEGGSEPDFAENHSLHILNAPVSKLREYEQLSIIRQQELNQQLTYSLLTGMTENSKIPIAFKKLGIQNVPERFCIAVVSGITAGQKDFNNELLNGILYIEIHEELINGIVCLLEMSDSDSDLRFRGALANDILEYGNDHQCRLKVGFSKVYTDLSFIEGAYKEALRSLRFLLVDNKAISAICAEETAADGKYVFPDSLFLTKIAESLAKYDYAGANVWCNKAVNRSEVNSATRENALFVRFSVLQKLVEFFTMECSGDENDLLCLCKEIDISNNSAFLTGVNELLSQASMEREQKDFARVIQYIDANYQRYDLSHNEVAEIAQVNPGHLSKLFRNKLGITYIDYLISIRMEKAAELLTDQNMLVEDVARIVGYDNVASFRKIFKRKYGFSPAEYRTQVLNKQNSEE